MRRHALLRGLALSTAARGEPAALAAAGGSGGAAPPAPAAAAAAAAAPRRHQQTAAAAPDAKPRLFKKLLVANRGEIAIRVMRTARRLGIPTVAVYSDADRSACHARFADEAVRLGPAPSAESYLRADAVLEAVAATGADAVHPGYGFLSENAGFAARVEAEAGATWVGPPPSAIAAMGDKVESKRCAAAAGVSTIPGWVGVVRDADHAAQVAADVGYPVMIKASAGGGGKGMRVAATPRELREGYALAVAEAASAFGDSRMLIERYVQAPRHVEMQVLGDRHGAVVHLLERECSIQRRNQKVLEEAPSPCVTPELRAAMGAQAVALARAVGYHSLGTCEFLVDAQRNFFFLEMNTRLQVEHPITEAVTGLDLVELQLRVAAGEPLPLGQADVGPPRGWALEARVYAEDPARGFLPSTGRLTRYAPPAGRGVRVDAGVEEGSEISVHYDPMIAKLVTHAADRPAALAAMERALDTYVVRGVQHNVPLLRAVVGDADFRAGEFSTAFLAEKFPHPDSAAPAALPLPPRREREMLALAAAAAAAREARLAGGGAAAAAERRLVLTVGGVQRAVAVRPAPAGAAAPPRGGAGAAAPVEVEVGGEGGEVLLVAAPLPGSTPELLLAEVDGEPAAMQLLARGPRTLTVQYCGAQREVGVDAPAAAALARHMPPPVVADLSKVVLSPMPGVLVSVAVKPGDAVAPGDEVAVVEAMKMRNVLRAAAPGRVASVEAAAGAAVAADQVVVRLE